MKIIIVGASDHQKEILEPLKNVIDVEVIFVDSIVKIESSKFTLINTPTGLMPDFMICDDVTADHKLTKENLNRSATNKSKPKQISYGPKISCGKGKTKRWKS